jgi:flagellar hook-length control protein FliK
MLGSGAPPAEAPVAKRSERPDPSERTGVGRAADKASKTSDKTSKADAAASRQDSTKAKTTDHTASSDDGDRGNATTKDGKAADAAGADTSSKADADRTDADKTDADETAGLDAMFVDAHPPAADAPGAKALDITVPAVLAPAQTEVASATDAVAALEAAAPQVAAPIAGRAVNDATADTKAATQDGKPVQHSDHVAKPEPSKTKAAQDLQSALPETADATVPADAKEAQGHGKPDAVPSAPRHAVTDPIKTVDADALLQRGTDVPGALKAGTDPVQNLGITPQANPAHTVTNTTGVTAATALAQAPPQVQAAAIPLAGLAVEIATQAQAGKHHFDIRLDPPELGRIDVKLNIDRDGNVSTKLIADRNDTLDLLKRDSVQLERALQDAGLKTSDNALQFSLRQQPFTQDDTPTQNGAQTVMLDDDPAPLEALRQGYGRLLGLGAGLDIRV